jgi:hypothetical protein
MNMDDFETRTIHGSASVKHIEFHKYTHGARNLQVRKLMTDRSLNY